MSTVETNLPIPTSSRWWSGFWYLLLFAVGAGLFFLVRDVGETVVAPASTALDRPVAKVQPGGVDVVRHVIITLAAVIGLGYVLGRCCRFVGQPRVIGEILAGIVLGPSVLGAISPDAMYALIPSSETDPKEQVSAALKAISQLGVILYMFLVGLELNAAQLRRKIQTAIAVSQTGIVVPFVLGTGLSLWLYPLLSHQGVPFTSFALFIGVAMSITAFPVLARILTDRQLHKTELGIVALSCAAVGDVTAWCLLALVIGVAQAQVGNALLVMIGAALFIFMMFVVVRPMMIRLTQKLDDTPGPLPAMAITGTFVLILLSALATEAIGIHAVFGAFLLGAIIPHDSRLASAFTAKLEDLVTVLFLPAFFAFTGMRTQIGLVSGWENWLICGAIILIATLGKFGGSLFAARLTGHDWRESSALGVLMNTRGLMELIVLNIGLDLGIISPTLFTMMVIMALVTTMAAGPILHWLIPPNQSNKNFPSEHQK